MTTMPASNLAVPVPTMDLLDYPYVPVVEVVLPVLTDPATTALITSAIASSEAVLDARDAVLAAEGEVEADRVAVATDRNLAQTAAQTATTKASEAAASAASIAAGTFAPLASPALTGTPTSPTPAAGTNSTRLATTAFVKAALDALVAAAPGALDTLNELAAALGGDANFAATMTAALAGKMPLGTTPRGHLSGLRLANNVADAANDIDVAAGVARSSDDTTTITLASAMTKRLDAAWAAGTGNGGLDTGSVADGASYAMFLIWNPSTQTADVLFSASMSAPTMPSGFTKRRYIGSICRAVGSNYGFVQTGDYFRRKAVSLSYSTTTLGTTGVLMDLPIPAGLEVEVELNVRCLNTAASAAVYVANPDATDQPASFSGQPLASVGSGTGNVSTVAQVRAWSNTTRQLRATANAAGTTFNAALLGWRDPQIFRPA